MTSFDMEQNVKIAAAYAADMPSGTCGLLFVFSVEERDGGAERSEVAFHSTRLAPRHEAVRVYDCLSRDAAGALEFRDHFARLFLPLVKARGQQFVVSHEEPNAIVVIRVVEPKEDLGPAAA